jgi:DNA polymerase-3 subunit gamma/tau
MTLLRMLAFRPAEVAASSQGSTPAQGQRSTGTAKRKPPAARVARAEAAAAPKAEPAPEPTAAAAVTAAESEDWHGLLPQLDLSGPVRELARNIQLESRSGDRWQFLIPDAVRHLGSDAVVQKLQSALSSQLGHPVSLALHTANEAVVSPAALGEKATRQKLSDAERAIEQDPTVQELKQRFGAQLIEDSVQPLQ